MATVCVLIVSGATFTIPSDFGSLVSIEGIGGGGNGFASITIVDRASGGGGGYAIQPILAGIAPGNVYNIHIGVGGGTKGTTGAPGTNDTWFNSATATLFAQGSSNATSGTGGGRGTNGACFPTTGAFSGGVGVSAITTSASGGGAAGKNGAGGNGSTSTGIGGQGDNGTGGAGGSGSGNGSPGAEWSITAGGTAGSGGGGGGTTGATAGNGGNYGAGGGASLTTAGLGAPGVIFFTYNTATSTQTLVFHDDGVRILTSPVIQDTDSQSAFVGFPGVFIGAGWGRSFDLPPTKPRIDLFRSETRSIFAPILVSGMAWRKDFDTPQRLSAIQSSDVARSIFTSTAVPVSGMAWQRTFDGLLSPDAPLSSDTARSIFTPAAATPVSGMAWWRAFDVLAKADAFQSSNIARSIFSSVGVPVSGMAWWARFVERLAKFDISRLDSGTSWIPFVPIPVPPGKNVSNAYRRLAWQNINNSRRRGSSEIDVRTGDEDEIIMIIKMLAQIEDAQPDDEY